MIVADTNLLAYLLVPGEHSVRARVVLDADPVWCAPLLWRSELRNVLATYMKRGLLSLSEAQSIQQDAELLLDGREFTVDSATVLSLAASSGRSAYDCEFVALAIALGVPLVTTDGALLSSFPDVARSPADFPVG